MKTASRMIRDYRESHGQTQAFIGKRAGIKPTRISAYETGLTKMPADEFLKIIVDGFGVTPQIFFDAALSENETTNQ